MNIESLITQLIILFSIAFLGYGAAKLNFLPKETNKVLSAVVINVSNPCSVLTSVMSGTRVITNGEVFTLLGVAIALHLLLIALAPLLTKILHIPEDRKNIFYFMTVFGNYSYMGFPVITALFGVEALFLAAIFVLVFQIFCYTYGVSLFGQGKFQIKSLCSPMIICTLIAFAIYMLKLRVPEMVLNITKTVSGITSPAAMLALGFALAAVPLKWVFTQFRTMIFALLRLTVIPAVVFLLCSPWMKNELMLGVTVALSAMPVATNTTLMAARYNGNESQAACGVFLSTLMSVVIMPLMLGLLFGLF
mgnify:CR=1 FL=1